MESKELTFKESTAQQLAWERGRDTPNAKDTSDADEMCEQINFKRMVIYGLDPID